MHIRVLMEEEIFWKCLVYFFVNIFNRGIYVLIFNFFFSDEYLIIRATEDLKNSTLGWFLLKMGVYNKNLIIQLCCALFHVCKVSRSDLNLIFLPHTWVAILGDFGGVIKKLFNSFLSAHRLRVYTKFVASMVSEKRCLDMTDIRTG